MLRRTPEWVSVYQINNGRNRGSDTASGIPWAWVDDSDHRRWIEEVYERGHTSQGASLTKIQGSPKVKPSGQPSGPHYNDPSRRLAVSQRNLHHYPANRKRPLGAASGCPDEEPGEARRPTYVGMSTQIRRQPPHRLEPLGPQGCVVIVSQQPRSGFQPKCQSLQPCQRYGRDHCSTVRINWAKVKECAADGHEYDLGVWPE